MDAVQASKSGHLGLPLGCAEIGAVLYGYALQHNPDKPRWIGRDYFVLSAGHGSMFLYSWLHLSGYDLPMEEIKRFRQLHSKTPGHPEFFETPGVECTTGPLGQGVANAVGVAVAAKMAAARFNTPEHMIFDQHVICLAGDGCLQEGVSAEASAFAGHFGLDNLILIYDSNARHARRDGVGDAERGHRQTLPGLRLRCAEDRRPGHDRLSARVEEGEGARQREAADDHRAHPDRERHSRSRRHREGAWRSRREIRGRSAQESRITAGALLCLAGSPGLLRQAQEEPAAAIQALGKDVRGLAAEASRRRRNSSRTRSTKKCRPI